MFDIHQYTLLDYVDKYINFYLIKTCFVCSKLNVETAIYPWQRRNKTGLRFSLKTGLKIIRFNLILHLSINDQIVDNH